MTVMIPFDSAALGGTDPLSVDLVFHDPLIDEWVLAVAANTVPSPGHPGPVGDRIVFEGGTPPVLSGELGDHGVFWDPGLGQGFAWANVDHATDFSAAKPFGPAFIRGDANADGLFDIADPIMILLFLFSNGTVPCENALDANADQLIDVADPIYVLGSLFINDPPPPAPHPECGLDPSGSAIPCDEFPGCP